MITDMYYRKAVIRNIVDGDTFDATVDLGFDVSVKQRFRIIGIDAPELNTLAGERSKKALEELIYGKEVIIKSTKADSFGRYLADAHLQGEDRVIKVSEYMIETGNAILYTK